MGEQKTVDQIDTTYSKSQLYWRINKLVESGMMEPPERGERNQYLLGPKEVRTLQRLSDLEEDYDTVQEAIEELEIRETESETGEEVQDQERLERLEDRIDSLEKKVENIEDILAVQNDKLREFRERWRDQLKEGVNKIKDLFG